VVFLTDFVPFGEAYPACLCSFSWKKPVSGMLAGEVGDEGVAFAVFAVGEFSDFAVVDFAVVAARPDHQSVRTQFI
jgi:hypothetical protein